MTQEWDAPPHVSSLQSSKEGIMKRLTVFVVAIVALGAGSAAIAQHSGHVVSAPKDAQWGPAPPFIPAGAEIAVLSGDPTKPVPYAVRLKFPANYAVPAHSHPTTE